MRLRPISSDDVEYAWRHNTQHWSHEQQLGSMEQPLPAPDRAQASEHLASDRGSSSSRCWGITEAATLCSPVRTLSPKRRSKAAKAHQERLQRLCTELNAGKRSLSGVSAFMQTIGHCIRISCTQTCKTVCSFNAMNITLITPELNDPIDFVWIA